MKYLFECIWCFLAFTVMPGDGIAWRFHNINSTRKHQRFDKICILYVLSHVRFIPLYNPSDMHSTLISSYNENCWWDSFRVSSHRSAHCKVELLLIHLIPQLDSPQSPGHFWHERLDTLCVWHFGFAPTCMVWFTWIGTLTFVELLYDIKWPLVYFNKHYCF